MPWSVFFSRFTGHFGQLCPPSPSSPPNEPDLPPFFSLMAAVLKHSGGPAALASLPASDHPWVCLANIRVVPAEVIERVKDWPTPSGLEEVLSTSRTEHGAVLAALAASRSLEASLVSAGPARRFRL